MTKAMRRAVYYGIAWYEPNGIITSEQISRQTGINATQIRRDLSELLGHAGKRGVGYRCSSLIDRLQKHIDREAEAVADEIRMTSVNISHVRFGVKAPGLMVRK